MNPSLLQMIQQLFKGTPIAGPAGGGMMGGGQGAMDMFKNLGASQGGNSTMGSLGGLGSSLAGGAVAPMGIGALIEAARGKQGGAGALGGSALLMSLLSQL